MVSRPDFSSLTLSERQREAIAICFVECSQDLLSGEYKSGLTAGKVGIDGDLSSNRIFVTKEALLYYGHKYLRNVNEFAYLLAKDKESKFKTVRRKDAKNSFWLPFECVTAEIEYAKAKNGDYRYFSEKWHKGKGIFESLAKVHYGLGGIYSEGKGVPQDYAEAFFWLTLALQSGELDKEKTEEACAQIEFVQKSLSSEKIATIEEQIKNWNCVRSKQKYLDSLVHLKGDGPFYFYGYESDGPGPELLTNHHLKIGLAEAEGRADKQRYYKFWYPGRTRKHRWRILMKDKASATAAEELFKACFGRHWTRWTDTGQRDLDEFFIASEIEIQEIAQILGSVRK